MIPKTTYPGGKATAADSQKYPMVVIVSLKNTQHDIYLMRFNGIANDNYIFNQTAYGKGAIKLEYAKSITNEKYCSWVEEKTSIINI